MNLDLRCIGAWLVLLAVLGVSWAVPVDLYDPEWQQDDAQQEDTVKRFADDWKYSAALPPRDNRGRKNWRSSPYRSASLVDNSVKTFSSRISYCSNDQVCKQAEKSTFDCRCSVYTYCVADGRQYDAKCRYSKVGLVFNQPRW